MQKSHIFFLIFFASIKGFESFAQGGHGYYDDALRFSKLTFGGSARFQSVGGATTALGADIGALSSNPAGLGMYNRSDMNATAALGTANTNSSYLDNSQKDHRTFFNIPSSGIVFGGPKDDTVHAWKGGTFGIGLTNVNNFQNQFSYEGDNTKNSMTDFFVEQTNGIRQDSFFLIAKDNLQSIPSLAYYAYLVEPVNPASSANTQYRSFIHGDTVHQHETILTKGKQIQWDVAYGGNINDKLYLGLSMGIVSLKYTANKTFTESTHPGDTLNSYTLVTNRTLKGTGINLRLGMIYKVTEWIRLGATIQTPTYYSIRQTTSYSTDAFFDSIPYPSPYGSPDPEEKAKTLPVITKYKLMTPLRISTGIALFARKQGFISADIGYLNYGASKFKENQIYATKDNSTFTADNQSIKNLYHSVFNINTGAEYRKDILRLRAGLAWYGNPYRNSSVNQSVKNFTLGIGFRFETYYFDMAYVHSSSKSIYQPYGLKDGSAPTVITKNNSGRVLATFGILF